MTNILAGQVKQALPKEEIAETPDLKGLVPESWACIDCGFNTAPRLPNRIEAEQAFVTMEGDNVGVEQTIDAHSEVYTVRDAVWKAAGMEPFGGCLCIGCIEKRLERRLKPKDFLRHHPFNADHMPGTPRLRKRRGRK